MYHTSIHKNLFTGETKKQTDLGILKFCSEDHVPSNFEKSKPSIELQLITHQNLNSTTL